MNTILVKVEGEAAPPFHNGFSVSARKVWKQADVWHADTGVELSLPTGLTLEIEPLEGVFVLAWSTSGLTIPAPDACELPKGRLAVAVSGAVKLNEPFAKVWIVARSVVPVRFLRRDASGTRVVTGDAKSAVSTENPKPKF